MVLSLCDLTAVQRFKSVLNYCCNDPKKSDVFQLVFAKYTLEKQKKEEEQQRLDASWPNDPLRDAIKSGDTEAVKQLLDQGVHTDTVVKVCCSAPPPTPAHCTADRNCRQCQCTCNCSAVWQIGSVRAAAR